MMVVCCRYQSSEKKYHDWLEFAETLGLAFQLRDDLEDRHQDEFEQVSSQMKSPNLVRILGLNAAKARLHVYADKLNQCLVQLHAKPSLHQHTQQLFSGVFE
jgi:geranylgeranyl pyrophosphate synthase